MRILVTGASGFVGAGLIPRLQAAGHDVRAFGRSAGRISAAGVRGAEIAIGDALTGRGLMPALDGADAAYYLIHSMEQGRVPFAERELRCAEAFTERARRSGLRRLVYLGVLIPPAGRGASEHLESRARVESVLHEAAPEVVSFRASIAIAARSRSFRLMVRLVERMPVLALPRWRDHRTQPIDGRDVLAFLLAAGLAEDVDGVEGYDIGGPDVVSYGELLERIRDAMLVGRPRIGLPFGHTPVIASAAAALAGEDAGLVGPLMEGLGADLLATRGDPATRFGIHTHRLDRAIEHALGEWERSERLRAR